MSDIQFNISLGRETEFYNRVNDNDPANSAFILLVLAAAGLEPDATLKDYDTVAALLAASNNEVTNVGYGRKTLTDADLAPYTVNDTDNRIELSFPPQTFTNIAAGDVWAKIVTAFDSDTTAGTDANLVPVSAQDLLINNEYITPNGSNIGVDLSGGWIYAT